MRPKPASRSRRWWQNITMTFKEKKADFKPGDRVTYASRVFDEKEMCALTDATLDFWLTTGPLCG